MCIVPIVHVQLWWSGFWLSESLERALSKAFSLSPALKLLALDYSLLEFTRETGYLSLTSTTRARLNISVIKIYVGELVT